jgi:hypothetical protein
MFGEFYLMVRNERIAVGTIRAEIEQINERLL